MAANCANDFAITDSMGILYSSSETPRLQRRSKKINIQPNQIIKDKNNLDLLNNSNLVPKEENAKTKMKLSDLLGLFYAFLSVLAMTCQSLCIKLPTSTNPVQLALFRGMLQYMILLPAVQHNKLQLWGPSLQMLKYIFLRGFMGTFCQLAGIISIQMLPLGDAIAISYSYAVLVGIMSCICLKERCTFLDAIFTVAAITGVMLIARPSFLFPSDEIDDISNKTRLIGVAIACSGSILSSLVYIIVRKMGTEVHVVLSLFYFSWIGVGITFTWIVISGDPSIPCLSDFPYIIGVMGFGLVGQVFTTMALQRERAGPVTIIHTSQILMAFVLQYFVMGIMPTVSSVIGATLIIFSVIALTILKIRAVNAQQNTK